MANSTRNTVIALTLTACALSGNSLAADEDAHVKIVLHVEDFARLQRSTLSDAETEVTRVFLTARVHLAWVKGKRAANTVCDGQLHLTVQILNRDMGERMIAVEGI